MRIYFLLITLTSFLLSADISESYVIKGMHCGYGCVKKIKSVVNDIDGVKTCDVDFEKSLMVVEYDDAKVNTSLIITSLNDKTTYNTKLKEEIKVDDKTFWKKIKGLFSKK